MSGITFGGLASGMDTASIVSAIMDAERAPLKRLQKRQKINNERLGAYSKFNDKLEAMRKAAKELGDEKKIQGAKTTLSNEEHISVKSSGEPLNGKYNIAVKQLSQVQKNVSSGFEAATTKVGTGTISFTVEGESAPFEIAIGEEDNTLKGIVNAVNRQAEETGISAALINDGKENGFHIVFSGKDAGTKFEVQSQLTDENGNPGANFNGNNTTRVQSAQQAIAYIDGVEIVSDNNTLKNAVPGVDITLDKVNKVIDANATNPMEKYESTRLDVTPDDEAMKKKVDSFIDAYNGVINYLKKGTDDNTSMNSYLRTDSSVRQIKREMQGVLSATFGGKNSGSMIMLSQAGIETQKDGTLKVDSSKLDDAIENHYTDFVKMFAGTENEDGMMDKFKAIMDKHTDSIDGLYNTQKESHDDIDKDLGSQIERMEARLKKRELSLNTQFAAMEDMMALFNNQSSFLSAALLQG